MPTRVSPFDWTDRGIGNVGDTHQRYEGSQRLRDGHGARLERIYRKVGLYYLVATAEASDEESITAFVLEVACAGNIRTTTLRARDQEKMSGIIRRFG